MADRWTEDRPRRGYGNYGRRGDYGADDTERGGGYGAQRYGEAYGDYGRSFERGRSATRQNVRQDVRSDEAYGAGYGLGGYRYGEGGPDSRYGGQWGRGPEAGAGGSGGYARQDYSEHDRGGRYGRSEGYARGLGYGDQGYGDHRGRGPKTYTRSDERIREDLNDRLTDDAWLDASEIEVQVGAGEVTLAGAVERRADKRRAEDIAWQVSGVRHVQNNLRLRADQGGSRPDLSPV